MSVVDKVKPTRPHAHPSPFHKLFTNLPFSPPLLAIWQLGLEQRPPFALMGSVFLSLIAIPAPHNL